MFKRRKGAWRVCHAPFSDVVVVFSDVFFVRVMHKLVNYLVCTRDNPSVLCCYVLSLLERNPSDFEGRTVFGR